MTLPIYQDYLGRPLHIGPNGRYVPRGEKPAKAPKAPRPAKAKKKPPIVIDPPEPEAETG